MDKLRRKTIFIIFSKQKNCVWVNNGKIGYNTMAEANKVIQSLKNKSDYSVRDTTVATREESQRSKIDEFMKDDTAPVTQFKDH